MSALETRRSITEDHVFQFSVRTGYPLLQTAGSQLKTLGVHFLDMSDVFETVEEPVYVDHGCYFNSIGNEIMGRELGKGSRHC